MSTKVLHVVNISFVLPHFIGEQFAFFESRGISFFVACSPSEHLLEYAKLKEFTPILVNINKKFSLIEDIKATIKLIKVIKRADIKIVVGHTPKGGLIAMIAAHIAGINKRIYFRHGLMYETSKGVKRFVLKKVERLTANLATKVVCVSNSVLKVSREQKLGNPAKNIILNKGTCNGIDFETRFNRSLVREFQIAELKSKYKIGPYHKVVGFVGRLVNDKGINELIDAWKLLIQNEENVKLLLIGPFEDRDSIGLELKEYIINEPNIIYTGLIDDIVPYYCLMDVFILPSYREGFPTVILEASAMELPIITTKVTGCIDAIIENNTGLFSSLEPKDILDKLLIYLHNPELALLHGKNGRSFVKANFCQLKIWREIEEKVFELENV